MAKEQLEIYALVLRNKHLGKTVFTPEELSEDLISISEHSVRKALERLVDERLLCAQDNDRYEISCDIATLRNYIKGQEMEKALGQASDKEPAQEAAVTLDELIEGEWELVRHKKKSEKSSSIDDFLGSRRRSVLDRLRSESCHDDDSDGDDDDDAGDDDEDSSTLFKSLFDDDEEEDTRFETLKKAVRHTVAQFPDYNAYSGIFHPILGVTYPDGQTRVRFRLIEDDADRRIFLSDCGDLKRYLDTVVDGADRRRQWITVRSVLRTLCTMTGAELLRGEMRIDVTGARFPRILHHAMYTYLGKLEEMIYRTGYLIEAADKAAKQSRQTDMQQAERRIAKRAASLENDGADGTAEEHLRAVIDGLLLQAPFADRAETLQMCDRIAELGDGNAYFGFLIRGARAAIQSMDEESFELVKSHKLLGEACCAELTDEDSDDGEASSAESDSMRGGAYGNWTCDETGAALDALSRTVADIAASRVNFCSETDKASEVNPLETDEGGSSDGADTPGCGSGDDPDGGED